MPEEEQNEPKDKEFDRRAFFVRLGLGSLSIAAAGTAAFAYQFLSPNVLFEPSPVVNAGKPENYAVDSVTLDVNSGIYLMHDRMETGVGDHRVPVSWQQVHAGRGQD
jgi:hypothetical protein